MNHLRGVTLALRELSSSFKRCSLRKPCTKRYEHGSIVLASNLPFGQWSSAFADEQIKSTEARTSEIESAIKHHITVNRYEGRNVTGRHTHKNLLLKIVCLRRPHRHLLYHKPNRTWSGGDMNNGVWLYEDFEVGYSFPPSQYSIDAADSHEFVSLFSHSPIKPDATCEATKSSIARPVHPIQVGSFQPQHAAFSWPTGVLHAREKIELSAAVFPAESLEAQISVKGKYIKNDKKFVILEIIIRKLGSGVKAMTVERTLVWPQ